MQICLKLTIFKKKKTLELSLIVIKTASEMKMLLVTENNLNRVMVVGN
jgi:hypothetical protein